MLLPFLTFTSDSADILYRIHYNGVSIGEGTDISHMILGSFVWSNFCLCNTLESFQSRNNLQPDYLFLLTDIQSLLVIKESTPSPKRGFLLAVWMRIAGCWLSQEVDGLGSPPVLDEKSKAQRVRILAPPKDDKEQNPRLWYDILYLLSEHFDMIFNCSETFWAENSGLIAINTVIPPFISGFALDSS